MASQKEVKQMKQFNLKDNLAQIKTVTNVSEHYGYLKLETACPIKYCNESLVLYAQETNDGILLTDLAETYEDALLNGFSEEQLKSITKKHHLTFDNKCITTITNNPETAIQAFFNLITELDL